MSKNIIVTISFIVLLIGLFLFTANEYVKRVEKRVIDTYLQSISNEFREHSFKIEMDSTICSGFIKHICTIDNVTIYNYDPEILLKDIKIEITNITNNQIGVRFSVDNISHTFSANPYFIFLPTKLTYSLHLIKQDSALGYVMLDRAMYLDFDKFDVNLEFNTLLREKKFRNKSIVFLLKEWFDQTTSSFGEYSLDNLNVSIQAKDINDYYATYFKKYDTSISAMMKDTKNVIKQNDFNNELTTEYFDKLIESLGSLLDGKINKIHLDVRRNNDNLIFFNQLSDDASLRKILEITEILDSINSTYNIQLDI